MSHRPNETSLLRTLLTVNDDMSHAIQACWSVTHVATPIAVAVRDTLFTSRCFV